MDIYAVRQGLAAAAKTVVLNSGAAKLTCLAFNPNSVTEPMFFVAEYEIDYDRAMNRRLDEADFTCRVLVGTGDDEAACRLLDSMFNGSGPSSLKAALEADRTMNGGTALGGACSDFIVTRMQGNRWYSYGGDTTSYLGGELTVRVIGSGS